MEALTGETTTCDVAVVGGGPAGCAAAIAAARAGASVVLLERGAFPRHKVCGEFVSSESLGLLRDLLHHTSRKVAADDLLASGTRITAARVFVGAAELRSKINPPALSLARYDLDAMLWQAALASGVRCLQSSVESVVDCVDGPARVQLHTTTGKIRATAAVNASGRWSKLGSKVAASHERWLGLKCHYRADNQAMIANTTLLFAFRGGYCGVQPVNCQNEERVNACALVRAETVTDMAQVLRAHPQLAALSRAWQPAMAPLATSPVFFRPPEPVRDGALQAGDAAGFIDPFVGDGIAIALRGGAMAGAAAARAASGEISLDQAAAQYAAQYRAAFASAFRNARRLRRLLQMPSPLRAPLFGLLRIPGVAEWAVQSTRSV